MVESCATVREVNDAFERHGYALPFNIVLARVRFGGLIATGSHGSGWNSRTLSDLAHSIEVVTASTTAIVCSPLPSARAADACSYALKENLLDVRPLPQTPS